MWIMVGENTKQQQMLTDQLVAGVSGWCGWPPEHAEPCSLNLVLKEPV